MIILSQEGNRIVDWSRVQKVPHSSSRSQMSSRRAKLITAQAAEKDMGGADGQAGIY